VSIARNLAARGLKIGVLSLEDEREWLVERILAEAASVPLFLLGTRPLTELQKMRVEDSSGAVYELLKNILVDDAVAMTPAEAVASARAMVARGCKAIVVDHLGELRLERTDRHDLDVQAALQDLRAISKRYKVPMVVACHLRRREGLTLDAVPRLTDFAFSASLERSARIALALFRPKAESGEEQSLGVAVLKQTKGPPDFNFKLRVGKLYGTVQQTPVSQAMRDEFGPWREN
jgi:replicative DNA helicase